LLSLGRKSTGTARGRKSGEAEALRAAASAAGQPGSSAPEDTPHLLTCPESQFDEAADDQRTSAFRHSADRQSVQTAGGHGDHQSFRCAGESRGSKADTRSSNHFTDSEQLFSNAHPMGKDGSDLHFDGDLDADDDLYEQPNFHNDNSTSTHSKSGQNKVKSSKKKHKKKEIKGTINKNGSGQSAGACCSGGGDGCQIF